MNRFNKGYANSNLGDILHLFHKEPNVVQTPLGARLRILVAGLRDTREKGSWQMTHVSPTELPVSKVDEPETDQPLEADPSVGPLFSPEEVTSIPEINHVNFLKRIGGAMLSGYNATTTLSKRVFASRESLRPSPKVLFMAAGVLAVAGVAASIDQFKRNR